MHETGETDQFQLLEEKVDSLIELITELKNEKALLIEKVQGQDEKIAVLNEQIQGLKTASEKAKQRILSMLEKIERIDV